MKDLKKIAQKRIGKTKKERSDKMRQLVLKRHAHTTSEQKTEYAHIALKARWNK